MSKAYGVIRRLSEDVDLTCDIRAIASDLVGDANAPLPARKSYETRLSKEIRARLPDRVGAEIMPRLKHDLNSGATGAGRPPAPSCAVSPHLEARRGKQPHDQP